MGFWPTSIIGTAALPLQRGRFHWQWKCLLKSIYSETIFMKYMYKEQIQATMTINEFLRSHTNPSDQNNANFRKSISNMRRFKTRIYGCGTFLNGLIFCWMNDIPLVILFEVVAKVGNPSHFSGATAVQNQPKSQTFTVNLAVFPPPPPPHPSQDGVKNLGKGLLGG